MLGLFSDILFIGVCTGGHWQTSGQLVQELNVCTVGKDNQYSVYHIPICMFDLALH